MIESKRPARHRIWVACSLLLALALQLSGCPWDDPEGIPEAAFSADVYYGKAPLTVNFIDESAPGDAPITAWAWDFGDEESSEEQHPQHVYQSGGTYTVSLTVTNELGSNTIKKEALIIVGRVWTQVYGSPRLDQGRGVCANGEGDFVVVGSTTTEAGDTDAWVSYVDANGDPVWSATFGDAQDDEAWGVIKTSAGDFVVVGTTASFGAGNNDLWLMKLDADGGLIWSETYGGSGDDQGYAVVQTSDGGFAAAGRSYSGDAGGGDAFLVKTDADGEESWKELYGNAGKETAWAVRQTSDGNYVLAGEIHSIGVSYPDMYLVRTDGSGTELWTKAYGGNSTDVAYDVVESDDGGYMLCGSYFTEGFNGTDMIALLTDEAGEEVWSAVYGGSKRDEAYSVWRVGSSYVLAGSTKSYGEGGEDVFLININGSGELQWKSTFGGPGTDNARQVIKSGSTYVMAGSTASWGAGDADVYLVRCNTEGYGPSIPEGVANSE